MRFGGMDDKQTRDAYHTLNQERQALLRVQDKVEGDSSESDYSSDSDENQDEDVLEAGIRKIKNEIDASEDENDSDEFMSCKGSEDEENSEIIKMNFKDKKVKQKKKVDAAADDDKGIHSLKFMKRAE